MLGHVVNTELFKFLEKIAALQARTDPAFERMNPHIAMRRGPSMTINELVGFGLDMTELQARISNDTGAQQLREKWPDAERHSGPGHDRRR